VLETSLIKAKVEAEQAESTIRQYSKDLERLAMVARHTTDAVVITDAEGYTLWVNQAFTDYTGYALQDIVGKKPGSLLQGVDTSADAKQKLREAVRNFTDVEVELINYRKNGEPYWVSIKIVAIVNSLGERRFIAVQTDITRQVNYISTIKANQEDMDALFSLSPDGIVVVGSEGTISYINDAFIMLTGISRDALQGATEQVLDNLLRAKCSKPDEYQSHDEFAAHIQSATRAYSENTGIAKRDFKFQIDTPRQLIFERSCIESNQKRISRVLYFKDVTQKVTLENMKSEFITTAAHELRTPMSVILGYSELLKMRAFEQEIQTEMVDAIHSKSMMVASLLDDLLDVAVIEYRAEKTLKLEKHAFNPFIQSIADTFIYPNNPNRVSLAVLPEVPDFYFDAQRLERAIGNCLTNAFKFSDHHAEVKMRVNVTQTVSPEIAIAVIDEGIGMTPEQVSRVFEKFYRADKSGHIPGTGLGMVLVKDIMEAHGGRVTVESEFGKGTTVTLYLPIRNQA
ncbi:MAG: ATP-binding protein, partial [Methylotenera sp.]